MEGTSTIRPRSAFRLAAAIALGAASMLVITHAWTADAAPGDDDTTYVPITPCRLIDTRPTTQVGPRSSPLGPADTYVVEVQHASTDCAGVIPAAATGLQLNVTAAQMTQLTYLTIWDSGERPLASSLNPAPGTPVPNAVTTKMASDDTFRIYNEFGSTHVIADVVGYLTPSSLKELDDSLPFTVISEASNALTIPDPPTTFQSVTVTAPVAGTLLLTSQESLQMISVNQGDYVTCKIVGSSESDGLFGIADADVQFTQAEASGVLAATMSGSRLVDIGAGETQTYNLRCQESGGGSKLIYHRKLIALFTPTA